MATFGRRLNYLLKENKITHKDFAEKLNVHKGTISNWTTDRRFPDRDILLKISNIFNVSVDYLIGADTNCNDPVTDNEVDELYSMFEQLDDQEKQLISMMLNKLIENKK